MACRAFIYKGEKGINALISLVDRIGGAIYPSAIIESLWLASTGHLSTLPVSNLLKDFHFDISEDIQKISKNAFVNFVLKSHKDPESFDRLITFLYRRRTCSALATQERLLIDQGLREISKYFQDYLTEAILIPYTS